MGKTDWNNKEEVLEAVKKDGFVFVTEHLEEKWGEDREIVLAALRNGWGLTYSYQFEDELGKDKGDKELLEKAIEILNAEIIDLKEFEIDPSSVISERDRFIRILETINLENKHTKSEIAEGIEPTQTGMDEVTDEMIATQSEKNDPSKDEKPGEELGAD